MRQSEVSDMYRSLLLSSLLLTLPNAWADVQGERLLQERCAVCHDLKGPAPTTVEGIWKRKGPDLFYAGNKYRKDWLVGWLQDPVRIRPAGMYYGNHIKPGPDGDVIDAATLQAHVKLTPSEAESAAAALMDLKANSDLIKHGDYRPGTISMSMGELMFDKFRGCLACHEIEPGYGGLSGPEVYTVAKRLQPDYLISYMRDPQAWDPKIFMPNKHLKEQDLQKFVHYFLGLSKETFK